MQIQDSSVKQNVRQIQKHKQTYDKILNSVYETIKQKQFCLKRALISQLPASLPKLYPKDFFVQCFQMSKVEKNTKRPGSVTAHGNKAFKNFMNNLDQQQRKIHNDNMNLLGLEIKKMNYSQKLKKRGNKIDDFFDEQTGQEIQGHSQKQLSKSLYRSNQTFQIEQQINKKDLICRKIGIEKKQIYSAKRPSLKRNCFRFKDNPIIKLSDNEKLPNRVSKTQKKHRTEKTQRQRKIKIVNPQFVNPIYQGRFASYRQFVFKLNYAHNVYTQITKYDYQDSQPIFRSDQKFKAYIGEGNNGILIKNLIKRRFWWFIIQQKSLEANFIWTQLKINDYYRNQQCASFCGFAQYNVDKKISSSQACFSSPLPTKKVIRRKLTKQIFPQQDKLYKVFIQNDAYKFKSRLTNCQNRSFSQKRKILGLHNVSNQNVKVHNHLMNNFYLGNKKALFYNLKEYYELIDENPFKRIPLTFHIKKGIHDHQYKRFVQYYKKRQAYMKKQQKQIQDGQEVKRKMRNVWIVKPGELTNRGNGITVIDQIYQLNAIMKNQVKHQNGTQKTYIVQLYIDRPFLYQKRKFDIRHYILITHLHGIMKGYWFTEGYIRTTSYEFDIENFDKQVHLTNDAIQKYTPLYGRYEIGNKVSYSDFQRYLDTTYPKKKYNFFNTILPQMKEISLDAIKSSFLKLSPQRLKHNFQIFGMDFMIDNQFKPWLIEINTNPCLELSSPLLARLIPQMLDQALRLSLDVIFPPPCHYPNTAKHLVPQASLQNLKFELIFDEKRDGAEIRSIYKKCKNNLLEEIGDISEDEVYDDNGKQIALDQILQL